MYESPIRGENLVAEADRSKIFWKVDALLALHKELLLSLRKAHDNFPSPVGQVMKDIVRLLYYHVIAIAPLKG